MKLQKWFQDNHPDPAHPVIVRSNRQQVDRQLKRSRRRVLMRDHLNGVVVVGVDVLGEEGSNLRLVDGKLGALAYCENCRLAAKNP